MKQTSLTLGFLVVLLFVSIYISNFQFRGKAPIESPLVSTTTPSSTHDIDGTWIWKETLKLSGPKIVPASEEFTIMFNVSAGQVSGTTDCNNFFGGFKVKKDAITFEPLAMTKKFCANSQESEFINMVTTSNTYLINPSGELVLHMKEGGSVVFTKK
jgi:heat shock protein HslJ